MNAPKVPPFQRGGGFGTLGTSFEQPELPESISWAPSTIGAYITLALLVLCVLGALALGVRWYQRRAPRRAALQRLAALERSASTVPTVALLLKAVALDTFGRRRVATLSGAKWRAFLVATGPSAGFEGPAGDALVALGERGASSLDGASIDALFAASATWIRKHGSPRATEAAP